MKYYIDITLLPDSDVGLGFIWRRVFQQVHIALVDNKVGDNQSAIAIAIVHYRAKAFPLGNKLRLLADSEKDLLNLDITQWLSRLSDYCHITSIKKVPDTVTQYARFKRKPVKSLFTKAQRRAEHLGKPYEEVLQYLMEQGTTTPCKLPFIKVESQQTKSAGHEHNCFPLFIERAFSSQKIDGVFDCYGLSKTATVPWF